MRQRALAPLMIGRRPELAELNDHLDRARSGAGQLLMLAGEAGVGKSRLLREFARGLAADASVALFTGHCYDETPAPPYGPFAELIGRVGQAAGPALDDLRALLRELAPAGGDAPADAQAERRRLFHAIYQALRPGPGRTNVLVLEDLHWSDQASQDLLLYLARAIEDDRVLIVGTFRTDELHRLHPLASLVARLTRDRRYHELRLAPLTRAELAELLAATLGADPDPALIDALYERTEGNPFFAEEVLEGLLADGPPGAAARPAGLGALPISIKDSILRRVAGLDEPTAAVARAAAVVGRSFDFELLLRLTGMGEAALLRSLATLVERQLVAEEPGDNEDRYRFRHELIRQALYEELLRRERRIRHQEVLRALEQLHGAESEAAVDLLAYHAASARALPEAARYSRRAGEKAARVHAYREALGHFEAALEFGEQAGTLDEQGRAELLAHMGHTAYVIGDPRRAAGYWDEALPLYEALGERRRAADVLRWLGRAAWDRCDYDGAFVKTRAALGLLEGEGPCRELAMAYSALSHLHMFQIFEGVAGAPADCIAWGERALAMAEALGDDGVITHALNNIGVAMADAGQVEEGLARLRRSLAIALAADLPADAVRAYINLGGKLCKAGRRAEGLALQREGYAYAARLGYIRGSGKLLLGICLVQLESGQWASLDADLAEALRPGFPGTAEERAQLQYVYAQLLLARGRSAEARDLLEALLVSQADDHDAHTLVRELLILTYKALGDLPRAVALADEQLAKLLAAAGPGAAIADLGISALKLIANVEAYLEVGRRDEALAIVEALSAVAAQMAELYPQQAIVDELRASAITPDDPRRAAELLAGAIARFETLGYTPYAVRARRRRAEALLRIGSPAGRAEATAELLAARAAAEPIGFHYELGRIAALERRLTPEGAPRALPAAPGAPQPQLRAIEGLTPRELEVLALITRGLSNRAIAETLVISEKTAEVHVRNILGKLGFSSRTQAATYAVERGIVARSA